MKKFCTVTMALLILIYLLPQTSFSIPAFARKYGFNCNMCHVSFTKLNDFGQKFRDYGYQIPGQEGSEKNIFETGIPLALRTTVGLAAAHSQLGDNSNFDIFGLDILAAGVLHKNVSFMMIYKPRIDEPAADFRGTGGGAAPGQLGTLESGNIVFSNLVRDALNLRIGRFEPAIHGISSKRSFYLIAPYEIYAFSSLSGNFVFDDNQAGIEATGHFRSGLRYGMGIVNGSGPNPDNNKFKDLYLNISQIFMRGEGRNAGQRIGFFGYFGRQPTKFPSDSVTAMGNQVGTVNKPFRRLGADISLNYQTLNLSGFFMQGVDNKALNLADTSKDYKFTGGFVELDFSALPNNRLLLSSMYNWVNPPSDNQDRKVTAFSALIRYYLGDWTAVNVALHAEYMHRETGSGNPLKEDNLGLFVDFAF